jgi:hypothetical protein
MVGCGTICGVETISPRRTVSSADASLVLVDLFSIEIGCTDSTASAIFVFTVCRRPVSGGEMSIFEL